jgi:hypothetical protein
MMRFRLTKREILSAAGGISNEELGALDELLRSGLLVQQGEQFSLRHRVIAEELVKRIEQTGELFDPYCALTRVWLSTLCLIAIFAHQPHCQSIDQ